MAQTHWTRPDESGRRQTAAPGWSRVWDLPTRLFHWLLVLSVGIAGYTGFFGRPNALDFHIWAGYAIGALVIWRLIWGLFGSEYARLDRLFAAQRHLGEHLDGLRRLKPKHYAGHNPAGSLMILGLVVVLLGIVATGMVVLGGAEKQGILAGVTPYTIGHLAKGAHQVLAYLLAAMVLGHLAGVVAETILLHLPLVRGMITGWLPDAEEAADVRPRPSRPLLAVLSAGFAALAIGVPLLPLSSLPALGVPQPVTNQTFLKECGACHWPFHPSLLPRSSWRTLMGSLDQHFGEDASLPEKTAAEIDAFLQANAAETADTEAANRLREVSASDPSRITATPFWTHMHHDLRDATFKQPAVKSRSNCVACHKDAQTGRFDDQMISIPHAPPTGVTE